MSGRASPRGEVVDGMCDYLGHTALYLMLASALDDSIGAIAWVLAVSAGVSRAVQSVFAESSRRTYQWWAYGVPWLQHNRSAPTGVGGCWPTGLDAATLAEDSGSFTFALPLKPFVDGGWYWYDVVAGDELAPGEEIVAQSRSFVLLRAPREDDVRPPAGAAQHAAEHTAP